MAGERKSAVFLALLGNAAVTLIKLGAFLLSRSPALLSESIHSLADTSNQALLYVGVRRSRRPADEQYHWGYGAERYLFALLSAVGIFILGCGVTVYHGVHALVHPPRVGLSWISFAVLGVSFVVEGLVLATAFREVLSRKGAQSLGRFIRSSPDPTLLAVLFEDFAATLGVLLAVTGIGLSAATGRPEFDAAASIAIGLLLGAVAAWLAFRNRELILGPAIPADIQAGIVDYLRRQPSIESVRRVRTRIVSSDRFAFAAEVDYDGDYLGGLHADWVAARAGELTPDGADAFAREFGVRLLAALAAEIDRIEHDIRAMFPRVVHVDLESDDAVSPRRASRDDG